MSAATGTEAGAVLEVRVRRGDGERAEWQTFRVPQRENQTVLDVVTWIQREADPTLSYRFACRVGVCGSCAMTVNGRPRWTCRTHVARVAGDGARGGGTLTLEPLRNLPVIRDLATDMTGFFEKWQKARGRFEAAISRDDPAERIGTDRPRDRSRESAPNHKSRPDSPGSRAAGGDSAQPGSGLVPVSPDSAERREADLAVECINCAVCHAACDVVAWRPDYLGPAALNRAWAAWNDTRDADRAGVLRAAMAEEGCGNCHSHQSCAEHCPVGIDPTRSIAGLKRAGLIALLKGGL